MSYNAPTGLSATIQSAAAVALSWTASTGGIVANVLNHFDGANNATTTTSSDSNALVSNQNGNGVLSTAQAQFGATSLFCNGGSSNNTATGFADTNLAVVAGPYDPLGHDWTIECWVYPLDAPLIQIVWSLVDNPLTHGHRLYLNNTNAFYQNFDNPTWSPSGPTGSINLNAWNHIAVVRSGNGITIYVNGVGGSTVSAPTGGSTIGFDSQSRMRYGFDPLSGTQSTYFDGYIDEFRQVNGTAVYTSNFTPPTTAFNPTGAPLGYVVQRGGVTIGYTLVGGNTTYVDTPGPPFVNNTTYTYTVAAWDGSNIVSPFSSPASVVFNAPVNSFISPVHADSQVLGGVFDGKLILKEFVYYPMRPGDPADGVLSVPNMIINRYKQQPTDLRKRGVDFSLFCQSGETISNVVINTVSPATVPALQITQLLIDPSTQQKFAYYVTGGVDGTEYTVTFTVTLSTGQVVQETVIFNINVYIESQFP